MVRHEEKLDVGLWRRLDMRQALAARDVAAVYRLLQRFGVSQRRIAAYTGQSQSEISEILAGRQVASYEVLARIADGLGIGRGQMGLAFDEDTARMVSGDNALIDDGPERPEAVARLTGLAVGTAPVDPEVWAKPLAIAWSEPLDHVGAADVARLAEVTSQLRRVDGEQGGGSCRDAVLAQLGWAQQLLRANASDAVGRALHLAVCDLHLLAGWSSFDVGIIGPARLHFKQALAHARFADEPSLVSKVLYCLGRLHLHHGWHSEALKLFQLGQVTAEQSGAGRAVALQHANLAWTWAAMGEHRHAGDAAARAEDEFARAHDTDLPVWLRFFDSAELAAVLGLALAVLPDPSPPVRAEAMGRLTVCASLRAPEQVRSLAFELITRSWLLFDEGEITDAVTVGHAALDLAERLRSSRVRDRLAVLSARSARWASEHPDVRDLAHRIRNLPPH